MYIVSTLPVRTLDLYVVLSLCCMGVFQLSSINAGDQALLGAADSDVLDFVKTQKGVDIGVLSSLFRKR